MGPSTAKGLVENWASAWSSRDVAKVLSIFTDDCVYEDVTMGVVNHGKTELETFARGIFAAFPDFTLQLTSQFAAGSWAGAEWTMSATHKGDLPGLPATGKRFSIRGATVFELQGEKIRRVSDYWDMVTFLKQTGVMPPG
jgi:steroid delta-isomerase-like uncharacterized protein